MHCAHETTTLCHREAEIVCLTCGHVLETSLTNTEIYPSTMNIDSFDQAKNHRACEEYLDLVDICSRFHLFDRNTIDRIFQEYAKLEKHQFKKDEMMTYAIYQFLKSENLPRTMKDVSRSSLISKKRLWKIEKSQKTMRHSSTPQQLLETYYLHLNLSFKDKEGILDLMKLYDDSQTSFSPSTICSGLTYAYCKKNNIRRSMSKICSIFGISVMSCFRFLRYYSKNHS